MANIQVVAVMDRALLAFGRPVFVPAVGAAVRSFADECNSKESELGKHPEDYELFHLAVFDDVIGRFDNFPVPKLLTRGKDLINV